MRIGIQLIMWIYWRSLSAVGGHATFWLLPIFDLSGLNPTVVIDFPSILRREEGHGSQVRLPWSMVFQKPSCAWPVKRGSR